MTGEGRRGSDAGRDEDARSDAGAGGEPPRVVRVDLTFDGTGFAGWQRQVEGRTVQGVVEEALARILGAPHAVVASGRLDAGTHARELVVSFRTSHRMPAASLARALDAVLPEDVGVLRASEAPATFHARRDAAWKWYRYSILRTRSRRPLLRRTTWHRSGPLDRAVLDRGAALLEGRHDFSSFAATGPLRGGAVRTIHRLAWADETLPRDGGDLLHLDVVGDGFLHHMVRNLVGTLVRAAAPGGGGVASVGVVLAARDRRAAGPTVPASGLCLMAVGTRGDPLPEGFPSGASAAVESGSSAPTSGPGGSPARTHPLAVNDASPTDDAPPTNDASWTHRPPPGDPPCRS